MSDQIQRLEAVVEAAKELLEDMAIERPSEAKLVLALHDLDPDFIDCKENCTCDEKDGCDECQPLERKLAYLRKVANPSW